MFFLCTAPVMGRGIMSCSFTWIFFSKCFFLQVELFLTWLNSQIRFTAWQHEKLYQRTWEEQGSVCYRCESRSKCPEGGLGLALLPNEVLVEMQPWLLIFHMHSQRGPRNCPNAHRSQGGCLHL